ncbi:MAG: FGGY-family carbohydrate kinase [Actinomycetaceae bacterium]|nr:FGGY-family carbohydrate kinase [Actinomycetaceae bacterium]MDU0969827.1 FGGY-family carbohydrate kinase [Actinomycetaceae bacterium]
MSRQTTMADALANGDVSLGIELGSTRIKACAILDDGTVVATGGHDWENQLVDGHWSYALDDVWGGLQAAYADLVQTMRADFGVTPTRFKALGISAMMHGYLAFNAKGDLLVPFRTWRDTYTGKAAAQLTDAFQVNVPLRWSISHYYQEVLDGTDTVGDVDFLTTLAGYVHWRLTGQKVLGIGDAVGMFPIDSATRSYNPRMVDTFDHLAAAHGVTGSIVDRLPEIKIAGEDAGTLTAEGAALLDPTGTLAAGIPLCPPEGDAGTGMVATNAVRPRTGNVSVGTSIFAMVVLEHDLARLHREIDPVTTPAGHPVAMVHCNNGASEIATWMDLFAEAFAACGADVAKGAIYDALLTQALDAPGDAGGVLAYNNLSGEPVTGLVEGRPLVMRMPDARLSLANFMRAQLYAAFAALAIGMDALDDEGAAVDVLYGHGGLFRTPVVAQKLLATALGTPVALAKSASEGGAWGIAVLAAYMASGSEADLADYLDQQVFPDAHPEPITPSADEVAEFATYLERYRAGLAAEASAVEALPTHP